MKTSQTEKYKANIDLKAHSYRKALFVAAFPRDKEKEYQNELDNIFDGHLRKSPSNSNVLYKNQPKNRLESTIVQRLCEFGAEELPQKREELKQRLKEKELAEREPVMYYKRENEIPTVSDFLTIYNKYMSKKTIKKKEERIKLQETIFKIQELESVRISKTPTREKRPRSVDRHIESPLKKLENVGIKFWRPLSSSASQLTLSNVSKKDLEKTPKPFIMHSRNPSSGSQLTVPNSCYNPSSASTASIGFEGVPVSKSFKKGRRRVRSVGSLSRGYKPNTQEDTNKKDIAYLMPKNYEQKPPPVSMFTGTHEVSHLYTQREADKYLVTLLSNQNKPNSSEEEKKEKAFQKIFLTSKSLNYYMDTNVRMLIKNNKLSGNRGESPLMKATASPIRLRFISPSKGSGEEEENGHDVMSHKHGDSTQKNLIKEMDHLIKENEQKTASITKSIKHTMKKIQKMLILTDASKEKHKLDDLLNNNSGIINKSTQSPSLNKDPSVNWRLIKSKISHATPFMRLLRNSKIIKSDEDSTLKVEKLD